MSVLKIITIPDSRLKNKSIDVDKYDEKLKRKVKDLYDTLYYSENGIGLAAPQVGIFERIVVIDLKEDNESKPLTLINPKIVNKSNEKFINQEGCLSIPGYYADVERSMEIKYEWFDENGKQQKSIAKGLLSICIQHEVDHLNGVLFIDYLSSLKKKMALDKVLKFNKKNKFSKNGD
tara:strand:+ start:64 stop:594 length:531 start_codon:yes stop_codon:yes gene_type:complete